MFSSPMTWRTRASGLSTKTFAKGQQKCAACSETCKEGIKCSNAVAGVKTVFCWGCWAGDDQYNCKTCGCDVDDSLVVYCEGCGIPEHAGCSCDASVVHQDDWLCCFCTPEASNNAPKVISAEMEAILSLQEFVRQNSIGKLQDDLVLANKNNTSLAKTIRKRDSAIQALISDTKIQSSVIKKHETKLLDLFEKNKQLRYNNTRMRLQNSELTETLSKTIKKRKRDVDTTNTETLNAIGQLNEVVKRMRFLVKK